MPGFTRGHLVPASAMDENAEQRMIVNYMTNIVPQAVNLNTGPWALTEQLAHCHRGEHPMVFGGVVYTNTTNNFFVKSHGIKTPEYKSSNLVTFGKSWLLDQRQSDGTSQTVMTYRKVWTTT
jgi:endonuclease G, mitochondrial